jgi:hypothetical protein
MLRSISVLHQSGEEFLPTTFRAKLGREPSLADETKLAAAMFASCVHCEPQDHASLNWCSSKTLSCGSIKLLIRYRCRPSIFRQHRPDLVHIGCGVAHECSGPKVDGLTDVELMSRH